MRCYQVESDPDFRTKSSIVRVFVVVSGCIVVVVVVVDVVVVLVVVFVIFVVVVISQSYESSFSLGMITVSGSPNLGMLFPTEKKLKKKIFYINKFLNIWGVYSNLET